MSYTPFLNGIDMQSHLPSMRFPQQVDPRTAGLYMSTMAMPSNSNASGLPQRALANHQHHRAATTLSSQQPSSSLAVPPVPTNPLQMGSSSSTHQSALSAPTPPRAHQPQSHSLLQPPPQSQPPPPQQQQHQHQHQQHQQEGAEQLHIRDEELLEDESSIRLSIDLPGVRAKDLRVQFKRGVLVIKAVRRLMGMDGVSCVKKQKICRQYAIDCSVVDVSKVVADLDHGVLVITAPKGKAQSQNQKRKLRTGATGKHPEAGDDSAEFQSVAISP